MGKTKKKNEKKADKLTVDTPEDSSSKISSVSVTPTEELPTFLELVSEDITAKTEESPTNVPTIVPSPELYEKPALTQIIIEKYEGELVHGLYEGEGVAYYKDGNVYRGTFSEGLMHGKGTYTWADGVTYEGQFSMNFLIGHGIYKWPNGSHYEGQVYNGIRHGVGIYISSHQEISYVGEWYEGKRHGKGLMYYDSEETSWYEGEWIHNDKEGWGVQHFKSGNIYEGQWKNNKFHGLGKMSWINSNEEYMGQWENGIQNGHGTHTWFLKRVPGSQYSLRNEYAGSFVNGQRHGPGQYLYANGALYNGEWKHNKKHGMGKFVFKNGRIYVGDFTNDQISEYPNFKYDRVNTPDLSGIRTQSTLNTSPTNTGIPSLAGSYMELDITSLLNTFPENQRSEELKQVEYGILRNLTMLKKTYKFYSSLGNEKCFDNAFLMTKLQFWRFLKDCKFHHYNLTLSVMDRILYAENGDPEEVHSPYATILLRTFLTNIVCLAYHITHEENPEKRFSLVDCFSKMMEQNMSPNSCNVKGFIFREAQKTEYAMSYIDKCWDIYKSCCQRNKSPPYEPTMTMRHFIWMMNDLKIINKDLTVTKIVEILAEDDPRVHDGDEMNLELELTFLEFFEALFGCAVTYITDELLSPSLSELSQGEESQISVTDEIPGDITDQILDHFYQNYLTFLEFFEALFGCAVTYITDELLSPSLSELSQGEESQISVTDEIPGDITDQILDHPQLNKTDFKMLEQDLISALKPTEKLSPPPPFQSKKKLQKKVVTDKWFHQINIFFLKVFFPAYEHVEQLKAEIPKNKRRQAEQARLQQIREEEEARLKALKAEEEAKKLEQMELERASALMEDMQVSKDQTDDSKSGQDTSTPKDEPSVPPSTASTKKTAGKKKKK
ncbi:PREDICTED: radial spoke head 10 homolog B2-like [Nanorana parkeri]|uniref:radial spoke head 10 homolog B2-like n=1 Tax=Nanorana parkeri TaxID=125878 RepID=UPI000854D162|nr:PREDICTED: radial spoke head 10 homolog B2-like [Nanorana parkeri]